MNYEENSQQTLPPVLAIVLGGVIGGITAAILTSPKRRELIVEGLKSLDEKTIEVRPYIAKRLSEYSHAVETEMKKKAERIQDERENPHLTN